MFENINRRNEIKTSLKNSRGKIHKTELEKVVSFAVISPHTKKVKYMKGLELSHLQTGDNFDIESVA